MGISNTSAEYLIQEAARGVPFGDVLTLGRQNLLASPIILHQMLQQYGCEGARLPLPEFQSRICQAPADSDRNTPYYADGLLKLLGAKTLSAMDVSTFEGANIIHDLNLPIQEDLYEKFDLVLDGGLLEHVFNFPLAIKNCMQMLKAGGRFVLITPANNLFGHGFYQFSPELFYRIFSQENGFEIERIVAVEMDAYPVFLTGGIYSWIEEAGKWYDVVDPHQIGGRVTLRNANPVYLHITARRTQVKEMFSHTPQQSDYAQIWNEYETNQAIQQSEAKPEIAPVPAPSSTPLSPSWKAKLKSTIYARMDYYQNLHLRYSVLPKIVRLLFPKYLAESSKIKWTSSFHNKKFFKPVESRKFDRPE